MPVKKVKELDIITALAVAALAAIFISLPFFTGSRSSETGGADRASDPGFDRVKSLASRKDSLLSAIKDIEFDYGLGKLSKEDFEELNRRYRVEAAEVLKEMDSARGEGSCPSLPDEVEREIRAERRKGFAVYEDEEIEKEILRAREAAWHGERGEQNCPSCGSVYETGDAFCSKCGTKLNGDSENRHATSI